MPIKIKNWKLTLLAFFLIATFTKLGFWQLARAKEKTILLNSFAMRGEQTPLSVKSLTKMNDLRFYRVRLVGVFDNEHSFLLDNKVSRGQVGYEIYTPFTAKDLSSPILIDRGFIPLGQSRDHLPTLARIEGLITITGMLNTPPHYVTWGQMQTETELRWPARIEYIDLKTLALLAKAPAFFPYVLSLAPKETASYQVEWQITNMTPERHRGYAVQWFALALTLLLLFVALSWDRAHPNKDIKQE